MLDFRVRLLSFSKGGGREALRHQRSLSEPSFFNDFVKRDVLLAWELSFQLELNSHANKTDVFDFKNKVFRCLSFSRFFIIFNAEACLAS